MQKNKNNINPPLTIKSNQNQMKKLLLTMALVSTGFFGIHASEKNNQAGSDSSESIKTEIMLVNQQLRERLDEIHLIDKSEMSKPDQAKLKKEERAIQKKLALNGGVYIGVGALVVIIVILILVF